jgi:hypothetical protein
MYILYFIKSKFRTGTKRNEQFMAHIEIVATPIGYYIGEDSTTTKAGRI